MANFDYSWETLPVITVMDTILGDSISPHKDHSDIFALKKVLQGHTKHTHCKISRLYESTQTFNYTIILFFY